MLLYGAFVVALVASANASAQSPRPDGVARAAVAVHSINQGTAPPLQFTGVVEDAVRIPDLQTAEALMKLVASAGFNAVKITVPWSPGQAEVINDHSRVCSAATAANENQLSFIMNVIPDKRNPPIRPGQIDKFQKTLNDYLYWIAGPNGCMPGMKLIVEIGNEPNSSTFLKLNKQGTDVAAFAYTRLLCAAYGSLKAKAAELGIDVRIWGGALASSHKPLDFIASMGTSQRQLRCKGPMMDAFSFHPYGANSSEAPGVQHLPGDGTVVGIADYPLLVAALKNAFGYIPQVVYSEYGVKTVIPPSHSAGYLGRIPEAVKPVSEDVQAQFYEQAFNLAACQNVGGLFLFHLFDDPYLDKDWSSGLYYTLGVSGKRPPTPKLSLPLVRQAVIDARTPGATMCG